MFGNILLFEKKEKDRKEEV